MAREEYGVGLIRCHTDAATMDAIASASGLRARPTREVGLFYIINSGRGAEPEIGADLLAAVHNELERAARDGTIPSWSNVEISRQAFS
jgi:hypothetical protein